MTPANMPPHGTRSRYLHRRHPCRCTACRAANAGYLAWYRRAGAVQRGPQRIATAERGVERHNVNGARQTRFRTVQR